MVKKVKEHGCLKVNNVFFFFTVPHFCSVASSKMIKLWFSYTVVMFIFNIAGLEAEAELATF